MGDGIGSENETGNHRSSILKMIFPPTAILNGYLTTVLPAQSINISVNSMKRCGETISMQHTFSISADSSRSPEDIDFGWNSGGGGRDRGWQDRCCYVRTRRQRDRWRHNRCRTAHRGRWLNRRRGWKRSLHTAQRDKVCAFKYVWKAGGWTS